MTQSKLLNEQTRGSSRLNYIGFAQKLCSHLDCSAPWRSTQQAKFWELRAATSLVQFWRDKGNLHQAGALLRPIYKWFTEDHDLPDLRDAKALLDALPACEQKRA